MKTPTKPIIEIKNLKVSLGGEWVLSGVDLTINKGEIVAIIGGSGSGKTTVLRSILMLQKAASGSIKILGTDVTHCEEEEALDIQHRWGVLFQHDALFSSLTVLENVQFPLKTFTSIPQELQKQTALLKIAMSGLPIEAANKYPAELSGGMQKRAALARAIAMDPELLFLDEPTSGLDPQSASAFDDLVLHLRDSLGLTVVMVTHDVDTLWHVTDKVAFLAGGKIAAEMSMEELVKQKNPLIQDYFSGYRGRKSPEIVKE